MVVLAAVAPAVWRNWAAIRLALGRIYSDFRDYPAMVTFTSHSIAEVVSAAASISASTGKHDVPLYRAAFGEKQHPTPWSRRWRASTGSFPTSHRLTRLTSKAMGDDGTPPAAH